jgi:glycosyltransferase involved in cell wall biosynthesis
MDDLAVIVVSTNEARWLRACLTSVFDHCGACSLDVVVADNESTDETAVLVGVEFRHESYGA